MRVFIGSSTESREAMLLLAKWVEGLKHIAECWDQLDFGIGKSVFESLTEKAKETDAAIFVFGEDDRKASGGALPRDNVLLEYGLFSGILGPSKVVICRVGRPHVPSDVAGILRVEIPAEHDWEGVTKEAQIQRSVEAWLRRVDDDRKHGERLAPVPIWKSRENLSFPMGDRMERAGRSLFLVGFSFESLFTDQKRALSNALRHPGLEVRILMVDPSSLHMEAHQAFTDRNLDEAMAKTLRRARDWFSGLPPSASSRVSVRLTQYLVRFAARIYDGNTMLINFYLYRSRAGQNPVIELSRARHQYPFEAIKSSIESLWSEAEVVAEAGQWLR